MQRKTEKLKSLARNFKTEVRKLEGSDQTARYAISVSSELPVERFMFGRQSVEILSHDPAAVDLSRTDGMPVLLEHDHSKQVGVVEAFTVANGRTEAVVRFSRTGLGADVERDVADGIRRNISVGYRILDLELEGVDGNGADIYRATRWMPYEVSVVSVPADHTIGVGRAADDTENAVNITICYAEDDKKAEEEAKTEGEMAQVEASETTSGTENTADETAESTQKPAEEAAEAAAPAATEAAVEAEEAAAAADEAAAEGEDPQKKDETQRADGTAAQSDASPKQASGESDSAPESKRSVATKVVANHAKEAADIVKLAAKHGMAERAADFLQRGLSVKQAAQELLALTRTNPNKLPNENATMQNTHDDMHKYSFSRALLVAAGEEKGGLEAEVSDSLRSQMTQAGIKTGRGLLLPTSALAGSRTMTAGAAGTGKELVATQQGDLIEAIYDKTISSRLGVQFLNGLQGNIEFPREVPGLSAHWVGENPQNPVPGSELGTDQLTLAPKTLQATTNFTRQLLAQSSYSVEALVRNRLIQEHALKIDQAIFHGTGNKQPVGIYNAADVADFDLSAGIDYAAVVAMVSTLLANNTISDNVKFVVTPEIAGKLAVMLQSADVPGYIWQGKLTDGSVAGYEAIATNLLSKVLGTGGNEHGFICGDFSNVVVGNWGAIEIIGDPYSKKNYNLIEFTSSQFVDIGIKHGQGFVRGTGLKLA